MVGAATDYALLLVARYREELHDHPSKWEAMRVAWRAAVEPIVASAATVILGLLCLLLSELGNTRGLGPVGAIGIAGAVVAALTFLPAVLLLLGRRIFWPLVPRVDHVHAEDAVGSRGVWGRVAGMVGRHPRRTWVVTLLALLVLGGVRPDAPRPTASPSPSCSSTRSSRSPARRSSPATSRPGPAARSQIVVDQDRADAVVAAVKRDADVSEAAVASAGPGAPAKVVDGKVLVQATLRPAADSPAAEDVVRRLRSRARRGRHGRAGRRQLGLQPRRPAGQ